MIKIELQRIYLDEVKKDDLYCLTYLDEKELGCPIKIYKTFQTFQKLKIFCNDNNSNLQFFVCNLTEEEINKIEKHPQTDYSNIY